MGRLIVLMISLPCFDVCSQNLIINPSLKDINRCCEFHQLCRPEAWYTVPESSHFKIMGEKRYLRVNCDNPIHNYANIYYVVALLNTVDTGAEYCLSVNCPGNDKLLLFYSFVDSSIVFTGAKPLVQSQVDSIVFEKLIVKGKQSKFVIKPKVGANYLMFNLQRWKCDDGTTYNQYIQSISLTKISNDSLSVDEIRERIKSVYEEDRAHYFDQNCPEKTLKK